MADGLFTWIDAVWTKAYPDGTPPTFMMHRFLAADPDFAQAARTLQRDMRSEPHLIFGTWQALLPKGSGAPRLAYVAAKKPPAAEALTTRMMQVLGERRRVAEEMQAIVKLTGREGDLYLHFGIEPPKGIVETVEAPEARAGGLLGDL
jgi:hypothetical protein